MMRTLRHLSVLLCCLSLYCGVTDAKTFRWSSQGDMQSTDPHAANEELGSRLAFCSGARGHSGASACRLG